MEEIRRIIFSGFSSTFSSFYSDSFIIDRDGTLSYTGIIDGNNYSWEAKTKSEGFQLLFSSLVIELYQQNMEQIVKDSTLDGYKIEIVTIEDNHFIYTFYGLMEDNNHSNIRNLLSEFIPIYEELPLYMESKEENQEEVYLES